MSESYDKEIEAIGALLNALGPLEPKARQTVFDYVAKRLEIAPTKFGRPPADTPPDLIPPGDPPETDDSTGDECHISELVQKKKPRSAIEMAVLVAYYLSHKAPKGDRKQQISTDDLTTYFKISEFKLPKSPQYTLSNTKIAGYLESAGSGKYKLNPVGYNLVVHSMPKTTTRNRTSNKKAAKATTRKRTPKKKHAKAKPRRSKNRAPKA